MGQELQTLNERIAEKIGKDLVDLIPKDQWQKMVDVEIHNFKQHAAPKIISELIEAEYRKEVIKCVNVFCTTDDWNKLTNEPINNALTELLADSGGVIFAGMMQPAMQMVIQDLRNRIGY